MEKDSDSIVTSFYENISLSIIEKDENCVIEIDTFANLCIEAIYVIDFKKRCFSYVSDHDLFLCGHSKDEVLRLGYDFYSEIVHKDDLPLLAKMHQEILKCLCTPDSINDDIHYFSCTFRIKNYMQQEKCPKYLMVYQKLIPKFVDNEIRYGICLITSSVVKKTGNLRLYYKSNPYFDKYSFITKKWTKQNIEYLTEQAAKVFILLKQGKILKEIAHEMHVSYSTVQNIIASVYKKINVHTIEEAIIYITNHLLLFHSNNHEINEYRQIENKKQRKQGKQGRVKLTLEVLQRIQTKMNSGQSINSIAQQEGVSNSAIHKAIKAEKLNKKT
jgi:DNA-binding CsgD family transcriptional regulator